MGRESTVLTATGRLDRTTSGLVPVATNGTRLTLGEFALPAFINGPRLSACPVADGRRIPTGTPPNLPTAKHRSTC